MPKPFWKGVLDVGGVRVPVGLVPLVRDGGVSLTFLHAGCGARLEQRRWCPAHERLVDAAETVRGLEIADGRFVELTEEDLSGLKTAGSSLLEPRGLVEPERVELLVDARYLLLPDVKVGRRAYAIAADALQRDGRLLLVRMVVRDAEWHATVRERDGLLLLEKLHASEDLLDLAAVSRELGRPPAADDGEPVDGDVAAVLLGRVRAVKAAVLVVDARRGRVRALIERKLAQPMGRRPRARTVRAR